MPKTRQEKEQSVNELSDKLKTAKAAVFANFQGLKVVESEELRGQCREANVDYIATKKTLLSRAFSDAGHNVDPRAFEGGVAAVFGNDDEVAPAQIVAKFSEKHDVVKIFGGILEGKFIDATKVTELSKLPSKPELYARLVGTINAPVSGFVNVLAGNIRGLVNVLNAVKEVKA